MVRLQLMTNNTMCNNYIKYPIEANALSIVNLAAEGAILISTNNQSAATLGLYVGQNVVIAYTNAEPASRLTILRALAPTGYLI